MNTNEAKDLGDLAPHGLCLQGDLLAENRKKLRVLKADQELLRRPTQGLLLVTKHLYQEIPRLKGRYTPKTLQSCLSNIRILFLAKDPPLIIKGFK